MPSTPPRAPNPPFVRLYDSLKAELRIEPQLKFYIGLFIPCFCFFVAFMAWVLRREFREVLYFVAAIPVAFAALALPLLAYLGNRSATTLAQPTAARLVITAPRPYTGEQGLSYEDIERLKRVAEVEQGAAEWRGNFLTNLIVALFVSLVTGQLYLNLPPEVKGPRPIEQLPLQSERMGLVAMAVFWLLFSFAMLRQYWRYLVDEIPNRTLLLGCEEALAVLNACGVEKAKVAGIDEKTLIAALLGGALCPLSDPPGPLDQDLSSVVREGSRSEVRTLLGWEGRHYRHYPWAVMVPEPQAETEQNPQEGSQLRERLRQSMRGIITNAAARLKGLRGHLSRARLRRLLPRRSRPKKST